MVKEKNKEKILILKNDIININKLQIIKYKLFNYYEYNEFLKKICEFKIRVVIDKYCTGREINQKDIETIEKYLLFSKRFYGDGEFAEGPNLNDLRLMSSFGSGNFDSEELQLIYKINERKKVYKKNNI